MGPFMWMGGGDEYASSQDDAADDVGSIPGEEDSTGLQNRSDEGSSSGPGGESANPWGRDEVWGVDRDERSMGEGELMQDRWAGGDQDDRWDWNDGDEF
jgi:hypothetical protein